MNTVERIVNELISEESRNLIKKDVKEYSKTKEYKDLLKKQVQQELKSNALLDSCEIFESECFNFCTDMKTVEGLLTNDEDVIRIEKEVTKKALIKYLNSKRFKDGIEEYLMEAVDDKIVQGLENSLQAVIDVTVTKTIENIISKLK